MVTLRSIDTFISIFRMRSDFVVLLRHSLTVVNSAFGVNWLAQAACRSEFDGSFAQEIRRAFGIGEGVTGHRK